MSIPVYEEKNVNHKQLLKVERDDVMQTFNFKFN
jgi:hypothetical protein